MHLDHLEVEEVLLVDLAYILPVWQLAVQVAQLMEQMRSVLAIYPLL